MEKTAIRTFFNYDASENSPTPSGDKIEMRHREILKEDGTIELKQDVPHNIYEFIQASKDEVDIKKIIEKSVTDPSILNQIQGTYMDVTNCPKTLAEAQSIVHKLKQEYEQLPADVKRNFDNSYEKYVAQYGSGEWLKKTGIQEQIDNANRLAESQKAWEERNRQAIENLANMTQTGGAQNE